MEEYHLANAMNFLREKKTELHLQELQTLPFAISFYKVFFFSMRIRQFEGHKSLMPCRNPLKQFAHSVFFKLSCSTKNNNAFHEEKVSTGFRNPEFQSLS